MSALESQVAALAARTDAIERERENDKQDYRELVKKIDHLMFVTIGSLAGALAACVAAVVNLLKH